MEATAKYNSCIIVKPCQIPNAHSCYDATNRKGSVTDGTLEGK